jgi:hypothetical protein
MPVCAAPAAVGRLGRDDEPQTGWRVVVGKQDDDQDLIGHRHVPDNEDRFSGARSRIAADEGVRIEGGLDRGVRVRCLARRDGAADRRRCAVFGTSRAVVGRSSTEIRRRARRPPQLYNSVKRRAVDRHGGGAHLPVGGTSENARRRSDWSRDVIAEDAAAAPEPSICT